MLRSSSAELPARSDGVFHGPCSLGRRENRSRSAAGIPRRPRGRPRCLRPAPQDVGAAQLLETERLPCLARSGPQPPPRKPRWWMLKVFLRPPRCRKYPDDRRARIDRVAFCLMMRAAPVTSSTSPPSVRSAVSKARAGPGWPFPPSPRSLLDHLPFLKVDLLEPPWPELPGSSYFLL